MTTREPPDPLQVSVVIPTHRRAELVMRAVRSVLAQTLASIEVVVVSDGVHPPTRAALDRCDDPRVRVLELDPPVGQADARNAGVAAARAPWIAFLDDDDLWLPGKLERQLAAARRSTHARPIIGCRLTARNGSAAFTWPRRLPGAGEPLSEYLFCRRGLLSGEGVLPTSVLFTSRALLQDVPFRSGLRKHVDPDWLLRAVRSPGAGIDFVTDCEPLVTWNIEGDRDRVSTTTDWRQSREWIHANSALVTPRAYAGFLLTVASADASRARDWRAFFSLAADAWRRGSPSLAELGVHASNFLVPQPVRWWVAGVSSRRGPRAAAASPCR